MRDLLTCACAVDMGEEVHVYPASPDLRELMCESAKLIIGYQWVWDIQMTKFFQLQHWNKIPTEWWGPLLQLSTDQLNQLPFGLTEEGWPQSLQEFVAVSCSEGVSLGRSVPHWVAARAVPVTGSKKKKMTPKKIHEVSRMAGVVADVCQRTKCSIVLDIGSGLGYLGQVLREVCGLTVVEVEREGERVAAAKARSGSESVQLSISRSEESQRDLCSLLDHIRSQCEQGSRVCVVGLHCCGDLTPDLLRMVSGHTHPDLCALVVVGCCYHKMSTNNGEFNSFPISAHLRENFPDYCQKLNVFALRLASQETRARWRKQTVEDHTHHEQSVSYRAMLQAVLPNLSRVRSRHYLSFEEFARASAVELHNPELEQSLISYHASHHHFMALVEPFTALQVCMQAAMETLVIADRLTFLQEQGLSPTLLPLFDDLISPRNIAIVTTLSGAKIHEL